jgi:hypothetical protein
LKTANIKKGWWSGSSGRVHGALSSNISSVKEKKTRGDNINRVFHGQKHFLKLPSGFSTTFYLSQIKADIECVQICQLSRSFMVQTSNPSLQCLTATEFCTSATP